MKLSLYIIIYFLTIILIIKPFDNNKKIIFSLWTITFLLLCYSIQSKISDPDSDIEKYVGLFQSESFIWNPNLLREFLFWGLMRFFYSIFQDRNFTFFIMNTILSLVILKAFINFKNLNKNLYLLFGFLLFFPFLNGIHVIYRQLISMSILFLSISCYYNNKNVLGTFTFLISFLFHNITLLFFPLILFSTKLKYKKIFILLSFFLMPFALLITEGSGNEFLYRHDVNYLPTLSISYFIIFCLLLFLILIINYSNSIKNDHFNNLTFILIFIYLITFISLDSNLSIERIGIFSIGLAYFFIGFYIDRFKGKVYVKLIFFHISLIPLLTFYNSYLT